jgi:predicted phage tail component-like protein
MAGVLFDGTDLKATYGFVVNKDSERDTAELDSRETQLYDNMNGAHIHDNGYKPRVIKLAGQVYSTSVSQLRTNINALKTFLSTARTEAKPVVFPDEPDRVYNCKIYGRFVEGRVISGPVHGSLVISFGVNLIMPDPFVYGEEQEIDLVGSGTIENPGVVEVEASAILYGDTWSNDHGEADVINGGSVSFTSINTHKYYSSFGDEIITGDGTLKTVTNDSGDTIDILIIDLTKKGELAPIMQAEFGVTDADELTGSQVREIVGDDYWEGVRSVGWNSQSGLEDFGLSLEIDDSNENFFLHSGYVTYMDGETERKVVGGLSFSGELHGFDDERDILLSDGTLTRNIKREEKDTDGSGNLALSGYAAGTNCIVIRSDGSCQKLAASASVSTGWVSETVTALYVLETPETETLTPFVLVDTTKHYPEKLELIQGENHILTDSILTYKVIFTPKYL